MAHHPARVASGLTVSVDFLRGLIECALQCGVSRTRLSDFIADTRATESAEPRRLPRAYLFKLWERVTRESCDPVIGFRMAQVANPKTFGVLGQVWPRCANVLEAFRQTERYSAVASEASRVAVSSSSSGLVVSLSAEIPDDAPALSMMLWLLTNIALMPERLTGVAVRPRRFECALPAPSVDAQRALREEFSSAFGAGSNRVIFASSVAKIAIPSADVDLKLLLTEAIERHLQKLGPPASFEQGLAVVLRGMINGTLPTLAALSARLDMSERTLQRRLGEAGTSFQQLLQRVLREIADQHLAAGKLTHGEIAFLLGYSEESAFSRAYRSWTGRPPGAHSRVEP